MEERKAREAVAFAEKQRQELVALRDNLLPPAPAPVFRQSGYLKSAVSWLAAAYKWPSAEQRNFQKRTLEGNRLLKQQTEVEAELEAARAAALAAAEKFQKPSKEKETFFTKFVNAYVNSSDDVEEEASEESKDREKLMGLVVSDWASRQLEGIGIGKKDNETDEGGGDERGDSNETEPPDRENGGTNL